ncbi:DUF1360 domain-containing protein [Streptomyces sp. NPDC051218]|uniref:DUF1360 domain-containing protein n=1 Tax=Streptomyces sp. NPDC051218 TaxID=3365645 RepID=UPI00378FD0DF
MAARRRSKAPDSCVPWDVLLTGAAVFRLAGWLSKGSVTSPLRAPFTRYESAAGPAEVSESPRGGTVMSTGPSASAERSGGGMRLERSCRPPDAWL